MSKDDAIEFCRVMQDVPKHHKQWQAGYTYLDCNGKPQKVVFSCRNYFTLENGLQFSWDGVCEGHPKYYMTQEQTQ
jgi:hypothetical protein